VRRTPHRSWWMFLVLIIAGCGALQLSACGESSSKAAGEKPADVEAIKGSSLKRVLLSAEAVKRLGVETVPVRLRVTGGKRQKVIPYSAVLYTPSGQAFTYTSPESRVYVRQLIRVDRIKAGKAYLKRGPAAGTAVVTVGAPELFGVEYEVEED
jgi:hypothetical protein